MGKSVDDNRQQVTMTDESRRLLVDLVDSRMRAAVADGIAEAMTAENARTFVHVVLAEAQAMAMVKTGEVMGNAIWALIKRGLMFLFLGSIVYSIGGWALLAKVGKFFAPELMK